MSAEEKHYELELQDLIDGRLDPDVREQLESHIGRCEKCRTEFEALRNVKQILRQQTRPVSVPQNVRTSILQALDSETQQAVGVWQRVWFRPVFLTTAAAVVLLLIGVIVYRNTWTSSIPSRVAEHYRQYMNHALPLQITSSKPEAIESFFHEKGIYFETRVFDLSMMEYRLRGGIVHKLKGKPSALFVYEGPHQITMVCQMYPGSTSELPGRSETREHKGIQFFIYRQEKITMIFWQEGEVMCVLASEAQKEDVIQLAFAKAVKI